MSKPDHNETSNPILDAIRAKRSNRSSTAIEIALLEESLLADIEAFDINAAETKARAEYVAPSSAGLFNAELAYPEIAQSTRQFHAGLDPKTTQSTPKATVAGVAPSGDLLSQLRQQAASRQQELESAQSEKQERSTQIEQGLRALFLYLNEMVQQLNIVKPTIPRHYHLIDNVEFKNLTWQEGFVDSRSLDQSSGAMLEMVSFSCQLAAPGSVTVSRNDLLIDRFQTQLFDYGLQFSCKEFRNERRYVERAEFEIQPKINVTARWKADFSQGKIILETRNLERFGSVPHVIAPELIDQQLLEEFGRLIIGQPNRFRNLLRR
jgi:hypothetical protein